MEEVLEDTVLRSACSVRVGAISMVGILILT